MALTRVVDNLLANAAKYSGDSRWIRLDVSASGRGDEIELIVEDRGVGIPKAELKSIFEPFFRGEEAILSQIQGTGLGLSLVRQIVEAHEGKIVIESNPGEGTVVTVLLPSVKPAEQRES